MSKCRRIVLKISGEFLAGRAANGAGGGIDQDTLKKIGQVLVELNHEGYELGIVVGGGNIWRARNYPEFDRVTSDYIGMLATSMNALALSDVLKKLGSEVTVMNAVSMPKICEPYTRRKTLEEFSQGKIVIFAGGTGSPFFTTDSAAALRGSEIGADLILKATLVDGVYDKDPHEHSDAKMFDEISFDKVLESNLKVIDATAAAICRDNNMKMIIFNLKDPDNIKRIAHGEKIGTLLR